MKQNKIILSALLTSVFLIVVVVNNSGSEHTQKFLSSSTKSRFIASKLPRSISSEFEKSIIARYTKETNPHIVTLGHRPSKIESLSFGTLSGSYQVSTSDGKITRIESAADNNVYFTPYQIESSQSFLLEHRDSFAVNFSQAVKVHDSSTSSSHTEEFDLTDLRNQRVGTATFILDSKGHLVSLIIDKSNTVAAN